MPVVRYRALKTGWVRGVLGCVMALPILTMFVGGAVLLTLDSFAGVLGAVMCWAVGVLPVVMLVIGTRVQFIVDDDGLTLVHYLRTHRIPWEQIAVIEQSSAYWSSGAVVVVLRDPPGRRIIARATGDRVALYRGENPFALGSPRDYLHPPAQAAIAAHRCWLAADGNRTAPQR